MMLKILFYFYREIERRLSWDPYYVYLAGNQCVVGKISKTQKHFIPVSLISPKGWDLFFSGMRTHRIQMDAYPVANSGVVA